MVDLAKIVAENQKEMLTLIAPSLKKKSNPETAPESDSDEEFLSPVVKGWHNRHYINQSFTSGYDTAAKGVAECWIGLVKIKATVLLAANHLSTAYWNYAVAWVTYAYNNKVLAIPPQKALPEFGQLILVRSKRDHKLQDKGDLAIMMGIYPKISNGIVALRSRMENWVSYAQLTVPPLMLKKIYNGS